MNTESKSAKPDNGRPWVRGPYFYRLMVHFGVGFTFITVLYDIVSLFYSNSTWIFSSQLGRMVCALALAITQLDSQLRAESRSAKPDASGSSNAC